jgi:hypothetical protein
MRIRRRQRKRRESDRKPSEKLKIAEKKSIVRWKKSVRKCVRRLEIK